MEISTDNRFVKNLQNIAKKFGIKITKDKDRTILKVSDKIDEYKLLDCIVNQIITSIKTEYIKSRIQIKDETLIRVLLNYDKKTDLIIASSLIEITPIMRLDAILDFRLSSIKKRWDEIIALVNTNYPKLINKEILNELLRYLIQNMDFKTNEAHIMRDGKVIKILNENLEPFNYTDNNLINVLIDVAPRQIFIHLNNDFEENLVENIETLFPNCVCIEYDNTPSFC